LGLVGGEGSAVNASLLAADARPRNDARVFLRVSSTWLRIPRGCSEWN
jgi:hypothetical protein